MSRMNLKGSLRVLSAMLTGISLLFCLDVLAEDKPRAIYFQPIQSSQLQINDTKETEKDNAAKKSSNEVTQSPPTIVPDTKSDLNKQPTTYYRRSDSYATNPESDPPRYVRRLSDIGVERFKDFTWLDVGLEHRTRYEWRNNDIRRIEGGEDNPIFYVIELGLVFEIFWIRFASVLSFKTQE